VFLGLAIWIASLGSLWGMEVRSCFTPSEQCAPAIETELGNARKEILVAMYTFTSRELALALYRRQALPLGKARELAQMTHWQFEELLGQRQIPRQYSEEDLEEDIRYARGR